MSNIPLQDIKFPGLGNTYTIPQIDSTLSTAGKAADAKKTGDEISQLKSEITDKSDTADMLKAFPTDTASGAVASFSDGANVPVKSLIVNIDHAQEGSGDPSPTNVRPISGWDEVNVNACGINVWDEQWEVGGLDISEGSPIANTDKIRCKNFISVTENTKYYFAVGNSYANRTMVVIAYDSDKNYIRLIQYVNDSNGWNITTPSGCCYIKFASVAGTITTYNHDISINYPATDHDYHPYSGQSINIQLGQTVYGGKLDVVSGELVIDRKLIEINGNCTRWASPTGDWIGANTQSITDMQDGRLMNLICNMLPSIGSILNGWNIYAVDKRFYMTLQKATVGDSAELFNAWFASNPVQVVYPLATPLTITLTPHEVTALLGSNNIWADSGDSAVEYRADSTLYIQRLTEPDADMVADSNITSGQYFMVGNTLYKATANIASGGAITPNVNCTRKSLSEALNELNA